MQHAVSRTLHLRTLNEGGHHLCQDLVARFGHRHRIDRRFVLPEHLDHRQHRRAGALGAGEDEPLDHGPSIPRPPRPFLHQPEPFRQVGAFAQKESARNLASRSAHGSRRAMAYARIFCTAGNSRPIRTSPVPGSRKFVVFQTPPLAPMAGATSRPVNVIVSVPPPSPLPLLSAAFMTPRFRVTSVARNVCHSFIWPSPSAFKNPKRSSFI